MKLLQEGRYLVRFTPESKKYGNLEAIEYVITATLSEGNEYENDDEEEGGRRRR